MQYYQNYTIYWSVSIREYIITEIGFIINTIIVKAIIDIIIIGVIISKIIIRVVISI